ncbi:guanine nucleotide exchange protein for ADP-robosylation factor [Chytriomyces hyalinus]|nr:guanine nucleotide exchange protein for ADP-robosylation factor [Chytriomyces hyalinus]
MAANKVEVEDNKNAIFYDRIQAETIKKELRVHHLYEHYALSPSVKTKLVINNKPQSMTLSNTEVEAEDDEYNQHSKYQSLTPRERYPAPITSSQLYGSHSDGTFSDNGKYSRRMSSNQSGGDTFIKHTLEQLVNAREGKKIPALLQSAKQALVALEKKEPDLLAMQSIFQPFQIACQSRQSVLATTAIDCLGKLFTYNYWGKCNIVNEANEEEESQIMSQLAQGEFSRSMATPTSSSPTRTLSKSDADDEKDGFETDKNDKSSKGIVGQVVDTICDVFSDSIDDKLQLQIVKALMSAISSTDPKSALHGSVLLRAVRTTYNVFLFSKTPNTQMVAQATLQQMVTALFSRIPPPPLGKPFTRDVSAIFPDATPGSLQGSVHENDSGVGSGSNSSAAALSNDSSEFGNGRKDPLNETYRDLQLVFRALCKLSMKQIIGPETTTTDLKSPPLRSKLLSLHLINSVLASYIHVFFLPTPILFPSGTPKESVLFIHSVKQYLCLSLSRNTSSILPQVFDVSLEIFGKSLLGLRSVLKKEMSVVFTEIIIPIAEARPTVTFHQRMSLLKSLNRILSDPAADGGKILVEIYLNYDCDLEASAQENIWERLVNTLSMLVQESNTAQTGPAASSTITSGVSYAQGPPSLTTANLVAYTKEQLKELNSSTGDFKDLKKKGLDLMVRGLLKPLVSWITGKLENEAKKTESQPSSSEKDNDSGLGLLKEGDKMHVAADDPTQFQNLKHRKQVLLEGIKRFNTKPKKGVQYLLDSGCISTRTPKDIASFLLHTEGLNKTMIGEFLGEGDEENIAIMHAFVDEMDFTHLPFVSALRNFLQSFRLPGESQKIDRFMLKFAGRYVQGNPTSFSSADTAYVLAYSVIMLNTDQHNNQVKKKMAKHEFLRNNRGIDEGKDIPAVILEAIFDEIQTNEIVMKEEQQAKGSNAQPGSPALSNKRDTSDAMALKTEAIFNSMMKANKRPGTATPQIDQGTSPQKSKQYFTASHYEHVKPMFSIIWMSVLAAISSPLQESEDAELVKMSLEGFKYAAKIACMFDLEAERKSILSTLAKTTHLNNLYDLKPKNVEAIICLLDIATVSGNSIADNWMDVVLAISQLEKIQQLTAEIANQRNLGNTKTQQSAPKKLLNEEAIAAALCQSMTLRVDKVFASSAQLNGAAIVEFVKAMCAVSWDEITNTSASAEHPRMYCLQRLVEISYYNMNRIRVEWSNLWAILGDHFNQVGCHPNSQVCFFAIDKLRQLAMKFLELEELPNFKFQKDFLKPFEFILANNNDTKIKDMALACLQQMIQAKAKTMKSGWKAMFGAFISAAKEPHEQILNFSFDIVKSLFKNYFENVVANLAFPDFVSCVVQFCQNKKYAKTSLQAIELLRQSFSRIVELSKTPTGAKILQSTAIATEKIMTEMIAGTPAAQLILNGMEKTIQSTPINGALPTSSFSDLSNSNTTMEDIQFKFWFPVFHALYLVIMSCDLEVRTRALNHLFDALKTYGSSLSHSSWEIVANGCLFPIFDDLKNSKPEAGGSSVTQFASKDEMNTWVNTTMIQVLKQFIDLFGQYLNELMFCADGVFDLLVVCMTQENETLARIGSTCLQQFIESNYQKLDDPMWERVCAIFTHLFKVTTPEELFFDYRTEMPQEPAGVVAPPENDQYEAIANSAATAQNESNKLLPAGVPDISGRTKPLKKDFPGIITKCVLHLLVIQTLQDVLSSGSESVYRSLPSRHIFAMLDCLERSYQFAKAFNEEMELRMALYRMGFMKTLPNLLKQETSSVSTYITILIKMYSDPSEERKLTRGDIEQRLIPLSLSLLVNYNNLDPESKKRNVAAWRPVVVSILNAMIDFDDAQFKRHIPIFYNEVLNLLLQEISTDVRLVMHSLLVRAGHAFHITATSSINPDVPPALPHLELSKTAVERGQRDEGVSETRETMLQ